MARFSFERIILAAPDFETPGESVRIARCLSEAFSSGLWKADPMPLGSPEDPHSALGILGSLGSCPIALAAYEGATETSGNGQVLGCVLGAVLDDDVIAKYGLGPFAAATGDALLAYIGIVPDAQKMRVDGRGRKPGFVSTRKQSSSVSLARHLFESWLGLTGLRDCPRIFIRTREPITPILRLCDENGFSYCGRFDLQYRGTIQERLVFRRTNAMTTGAGAKSSAPREQGQI